MNRTQRDIIIGTLLGDGCLEFNGYRGTRLQIKQKEGHKQYVAWLDKHLADLCRTEPQQRKDTKQWYFSTRYLSELTNLYEIFYPEKQKRISKDVIGLITTPLSVAVWYMDDGTMDYRPKSHYNFRLSTDSFTRVENEMLVDMLKVNFGVAASITTYPCRGKRYHRLYIGSKGRDAFHGLVQSHVVRPCFSKKIPNFNT